MHKVMLAGVLIILGSVVAAYDNGVGAKPPMGWNTWCTDDICGIIDKCTDVEVRQQALALNQSGMQAAGYEYVNLDDCWAAKDRDANGNLEPDATRFPKGMKDLADYVHSLGLRIGLYTCIGTHTCRNGLPGSFGYFFEDSRQFALWGIDLVKCDNCNKPSQYDEITLYTNFSKQLNQSGRTILFSLCEWGNEKVQDWGANVAQMYRIQMDHLPFWELPPYGAGMGFGQGTYDIIQYVATLKPSTFVKQYGWMDPDFLMTLFWPTMSAVYSKSEFSFWNLWSAPLIVATNVYNMTDEKLRILLNDEVIAIGKDDVNTAGDRLANYSDKGEVWTKPLSNGDVCLLFLNGDYLSNVTVTVEFTQLGWSSSAVVSVRDLWAHSYWPNATQSLAALVMPTDVVMLRLKCLAHC